MPLSTSLTRESAWKHTGAFVDTAKVATQKAINFGRRVGWVKICAAGVLLPATILATYKLATWSFADNTTHFQKESNDSSLEETNLNLKNPEDSIPLNLNPRQQTEEKQIPLINATNITSPQIAGAMLLELIIVMCAAKVLFSSKAKSEGSSEEQGLHKELLLNQDSEKPTEDFSTVNTLTEKNQQLTDQIAGLKLQNEELIKKCNLLIGTNNKLQQDTRKQEPDQTMAWETIATKEVASLTLESKEQAEEIKEMQLRELELKKQVEDLDAQVTGLNNQLKEKESKITSLANALKGIDLEIKSRDSLEVKTSTRSFQNQLELEDPTKRGSFGSDEVETLKHMVSASNQEKQIEELKAKNEELKAKIDGLEREKVKHLRDVEDYQEKSTHKEEKIFELTENLEKLRREKVEDLEELEVLKTDLKSLKEELKESSSKNKALEERLTKVVKELEEAKEGLKKISAQVNPLEVQSGFSSPKGIFLDI